MVCATGDSPPSAQVLHRRLHAKLRRRRNLAVIQHTRQSRHHRGPSRHHRGTSRHHRGPGRHHQGPASRAGTQRNIMHARAHVMCSRTVQNLLSPGGGGSGHRYYTARPHIDTWSEAPFSLRRSSSTRVAACKESRTTLAPSPSPTPTTSAPQVSLTSRVMVALSHCTPRLLRRRR